MEKIFRASDEDLNAAMQFVSESVLSSGCSPRQLGQIQLAFEEVFVNVAHYAYAGKEGEVTVEVSSDADSGAVTIKLSDGGAMFNPLEYKITDTRVPLDERQRGGCGILLAKSLMDSVHYFRINGRNIISMTKSLKQN